MKVGTIGYGGAYNMGRKHLTELTGNAGIEAVAVCDRDPARLQTAKEDWPGIETYTDLAAMLEKSDAELIVIILPHNLHAPVAVQCLEAGRHVVVEKPFACTVAECDAMIAAARKAGKLVTTYHNRHWDGIILGMVEHLSKIGKPLRWESQFGRHEEPDSTWRSNREASGGILFDWGAHCVEYMFQCLGTDVIEIFGYGHEGYWTKTTNEDEVGALVRFQSGATGHHRTTALCGVGGAYLRVFGTEGALLTGDAWMDELRFIDYKQGNDAAPQSLPVPEGRGVKFYENVVGHLRNGEPLIITPEYAREVIQVLDLASRSREQNRTISLG